MAEVIAWLGIPVLATLAAIVWVLWAARPRPRQDVIDSVASYERFKAALAGSEARPGQMASSTPGGPASSTPDRDEPGDRERTQGHG
jgi:hypothetical protein